MDGWMDGWMDEWLNGRMTTMTMTATTTLSCDDGDSLSIYGGSAVVLATITTVVNIVDSRVVLGTI